LELSQRVQGLFAQNSIRINLSTDVRGVEVCGALKNVLAIAAGIVEGQGLGSNALAAVVCVFHEFASKNVRPICCKTLNACAAYTNISILHKTAQFKGIN
jgi:glycerol-3-phosphate dehydrogenase